MMMPGPNIRVSTLERIVPAIAFIVAAISGAVGGGMLIRFFTLLQNAETAGYAAFFGGIAEIEFAVGGMLIVAVALCAAGILVSIIRLFTTNKKSSPPGLLFLMLGLLSLVPPFAVHYVLHMMKEIVSSPDGYGISSGIGTFTFAAYFAIGGPIVIVLVLLAFPFIPFSSRAGRKSSPIVCLMFVAIVTATLAGIYFWEARTSISERDKDRTTVGTLPEILDPQNYNADRGIIARPPGNGYSDPDTTDSNSQGNAISRGVLNDKAIEFPQPEYPKAARAVRASGQVTVQVLIDGNGDVISATAVSGHPLLRAAAIQAARKAKFKPSMTAQPTNVAGVLTYNFPSHSCVCDPD